MSPVPDGVMVRVVELEREVFDALLAPLGPTDRWLADAGYGLKESQCFYVFADNHFKKLIFTPKGTPNATSIESIPMPTQTS